jgi:DNA polymerase elongation subunit (family B)
MYQSVFYQRSTNTVHIWDDIEGHKKIKYKPYAYQKNAYGTYVALDGTKLEKIALTRETDGELYESDVRPEVRVLIDRYTNSDDASTGHRLMTIDIETDIEGGYPNIEKADKAITSIAYYDHSQDMRYVFILDKLGTVDSKTVNGVEIVSCATETSLLTKFLHAYIATNPTIITGWNIDKFDIPYLYRRLVIVLGEHMAVCLSPIKELTYSTRRDTYTIAGVSCLDYMALYKNFTYSEESSYALEAISQKELGRGKVEFAGDLNTLFTTDIQKYIEYNMNDVDLVVALDQKMKLIDLAISICHKGHVPYEDVYYSTRFLDGAALTYLKRNNIVAPNRRPRNKIVSNAYSANSLELSVNYIPENTPPSGQLKIHTGKSTSEKAEYVSIDYKKSVFVLASAIGKTLPEGLDVVIDLLGAFVKTPNPGLYKWVYDLDLTSLYPSIIMTCNISPETKIGKIVGFDGHKYMRDEEMHVTLMPGKTGFTTATLKQWIVDNNYSIAANGVVYDMKHPGLVPVILDKWFDERVEYKNLRKRSEKENDPAKAEYYDRLQLVTKIMLNSFYGALGNDGFRFYDPDNTIAVTSTGQSLIKFTADIGNKYYVNELGVKKDYCIYTDTDSTFFSSLPIIASRYPSYDVHDEKWMAEKTIEIAAEVQQFINKAYDIYAKKFHNVNSHRFDIKQEFVAKSGLWIAKKRYAQWLINQEGHTISRLDVKGLDVVRSSFPPAFRRFMAEILEDILQLKDKEEIDNKILKFKDHIKSLPLLQVMFPIGVKELKKWQTNQIFGKRITRTPVHVKAALSYNDFLKFRGNNAVQPITDGQKIKWTYLRSNSFGIDELAIKGFEDPEEIIQLIESYIDYDKIFERAFENKLNDFYAALQWGAVPQNATLNQFFSFG